MIVDTSSQQGLQNHIVWYHRNEKSVYPTVLNLQSLSDFQQVDPLLHRTFGASIGGSGMEVVNPTTLASVAPAGHHEVLISPLTLHPTTAGLWLERLGEQTRRIDCLDRNAVLAAHHRWWTEFWNRSWIHMTGEPSKDTWSISTGWHLHRFLTACAGRGDYPIKFNGSIFNVARIGQQGQLATGVTADDRCWGVPFWFQNQRHIYWPQLCAGDYEQVLPFLKMYLVPCR